MPNVASEGLSQSVVHRSRSSRYARVTLAKDMIETVQRLPSMLVKAAMTHGDCSIGTARKSMLSSSPVVGVEHDGNLAASVRNGLGQRLCHLAPVVGEAMLLGRQDGPEEE